MKQDSRDTHTGNPAEERRAQRLKAALKANIARRKAQAAQRRRSDDTGQDPAADDASVPGITTTDRNAAR